VVSSDGSATSSEGGSGAHSTASSSSSARCGNQFSWGLTPQFSESFRDRFGDQIDEDERLILAGSPDENDAIANTGARGSLLAFESR
jgi:hypothetical protein